MIYIYCAAKHGSTQALCSDCEDLRKYALKRVAHCKFEESKPTCQKCPVHCYSNSMREQIREVMRYAGPRMIYKNPVLAIKHILKGIKRSSSTI